MIKHLLISLFALSVATTTQAGLIFNGNLPSDVSQNDGSESNTDIFLYAEQENFLLSQNLNINSLSDFESNEADGGVIASGTLINSFFLSFDAVGDTNNSLNSEFDGSYNAFGSYEFDTEILGIIWSGSRPVGQTNALGYDNTYLDLSDAILGKIGTEYGTGDIGRGLETQAFYDGNNTKDIITVDGKKLTLSLFAKPAYADQLRVITAVPEPTSVILFGSAILCLFSLRRFN